MIWVKKKNRVEQIEDTALPNRLRNGWKAVEIDSENLNPNMSREVLNRQAEIRGIDGVLLPNREAVYDAIVAHDADEANI